MNPVALETIAPAWTRATPTEPGFYWLRYLPQDRDLSCADVVCVDDGQQVMHPYDDQGPVRLDSELFAGAEWAGPLLPPADLS